MEKDGRKQVTNCLVDVPVVCTCGGVGCGVWWCGGTVCMSTATSYRIRLKTCWVYGLTYFQGPMRKLGVASYIPHCLCIVISFIIPLTKNDCVQGYFETYSFFEQVPDEEKYRRV